jgi:hypothetical protein
MPRTRAEYNKYLRNYMNERWIKRRSLAIDLLGGCCWQCGDKDDLEFDHINPEDKTFTIARGSSFSNKRFWKELQKCQLLCKHHHIEKTSKEQSVEHGGGITGKRNCYCDLCAPLKRVYNRERKRRVRGVVAAL